jgi:hypothetical protein
MPKPDRIVIDRESDGRWIAEIVDLPGVMVYGDSREEARRKVYGSRPPSHMSTINERLSWRSIPQWKRTN